MAPISGSLVLEPGADYSLGPANGTGDRPRPVPSSTSPGLTPGTQLRLSALHQWRSMNLVNFRLEKSHGSGKYRNMQFEASESSFLTIFVFV